MVPTTGSPAASNDPEDAPTDLPKSREKAAKIKKKTAKSSKNLINFGKKEKFEKDLKKDLQKNYKIDKKIEGRIEATEVKPDIVITEKGVTNRYTTG